MIRSFKSKALESVFSTGHSSKLPQERIGTIKNLLSVLHGATNLKDLSVPAFRLHKLKKPPLRGYWSIDVTGNFRLVFWFEGGDVSEVDYMDTH